MSKYKLVATKAMENLKTKMVEIDTKIVNTSMCKNCNEKERQSGSSRCEECSRNYKINSFHKKRIQKKVEETKKGV